MDKFWLIWSIEHNAWWKPNSVGYTVLRHEAGTYLYEDALRIVKGANIALHDVPNEAMVEAIEGKDY